MRASLRHGRNKNKFASRESGAKVIRVFRFFATFFLTLLLCGASFGQGNDASLSGTVTDASHAAVANARVTARNKSTNWSQQVSTDSSGSYAFLTMPIGTYVVTIEQSGFNTATAELTLETAQKGGKMWSCR